MGLFINLFRLPIIERKVNRALEKLDKMETKMTVDFTNLDAAIASLQADATKNSADLQAVIAKLGTISTDPATQAKIDSVTATLQGVVQSIDATNAAAEAASV